MLVLATTRKNSFATPEGTAVKADVDEEILEGMMDDVGKGGIVVEGRETPVPVER